jgi:hypothetical protein
MRRLIASRRASDGAVVLSGTAPAKEPSLFRVSRRGIRFGKKPNASSWSVDRPKIWSKTPTIRGVAARRTLKGVGNQQYSHVQRRVAAGLATSHSAPESSHVRKSSSGCATSSIRVDERLRDNETRGAPTKRTSTPPRAAAAGYRVRADGSAAGRSPRLAGRQPHQQRQRRARLRPCVAYASSTRDLRPRRCASPCAWQESRIGRPASL